MANSGFGNGIFLQKIIVIYFQFQYHKVEIWLLFIKTALSNYALCLGQTFMLKSFSQIGRYDVCCLTPNFFKIYPKSKLKYKLHFSKFMVVVLHTCCYLLRVFSN